MKRLLLIIPIILFLTGCANPVKCIEYTKISEITPIDGGLFRRTEYLVEFEDGSYENTSFIPSNGKCIKY